MRSHPASHSVIVFAGAATLAFGAVRADAASAEAADQARRDAWLDGRLEAIYGLNDLLARRAIDVDVTNGVVRLSGTVASEIERALAAELAQGHEGVSDVENDLTIADPGAQVVTAGEAPAPSLREQVADATAAARVRSNLSSNGNTRNLAIEVATQQGVVTLTGVVTSRKHKMLAEMIARNTDGITSVRNQLEINEPP